MTGAHRQNPNLAHSQRPVVRGWEFHPVQQSGRHRVCPRGLAGLAWPGEATARLMRVRRAAS